MPDPAKSVFINCPFDAEFAPLFHAIIFATVSCGFLPRSALESGNVAEARMERIMGAICSSRYSIHDLSRCKGEGDERLARFNMPLELGIAMALRHQGRGGPDPHDWMVMVPEVHQYARFVSDLAGFDLIKHAGSVESVTAKVITWLATRPDAIATPTPRQVSAAFPEFLGAAQRLKEEWDGEPPWSYILKEAARLVPKL